MKSIIARSGASLRADHVACALSTISRAARDTARRGRDKRIDRPDAFRSNAPMADQPYLFAVLVVGAAIAYVVYGLVRNKSPREAWEALAGVRGPGAALAECAVTPGAPFSLTHRASRASVLRAFLACEIAYRLDGADGIDDERAFGIAVRIDMGEPTGPPRSVRLGIGRLAPPDVIAFTGVMHGTRFSRTGGECRFRAVVPIGRMPVAAGAEAVIAGTVEASANITATAITVLITT